MQHGLHLAGNRAPKAADFTSAAALYGLQSTPHPGLPAFYANVPAPQSATALAATAIGQAQVTFSPLGMATVAAAIDSGAARAPRLVTVLPTTRSRRARSRPVCARTCRG